jgi:large subunit ribosomal protein L22
MGQVANVRREAETEAKAVARNLRISPRKLNLVAQLIRGKKVSAALADLEFSQKRIARDVKKCLESAIANAENNHDLDIDELVVSQAFVGKSIVMKRIQFHGRGRTGRVTKPFSNITIVVRQAGE